VVVQVDVRVVVPVVRAVQAVTVVPAAVIVIVAVDVRVVVVAVTVVVLVAVVVVVVDGAMVNAGIALTATDAVALRAVMAVAPPVLFPAKTHVVQLAKI
jgi:hypothetical protein